MSVAKAWSGFRSVLCAVDFSEHSRRALRYAAAVAARGRAVLTVGHINDPLLVAAAAAALRDRSLVRRSETALAEFVEATLAVRARRRLRLVSRVGTGSPGDEILETAARRRSDLVITALRDRRGWFRATRGSISYRVLTHAATPILACPPSWRPR